MESRDAEFSEHGRTKLLPVNKHCANPNCCEEILESDSWGRNEDKMRVHFPKCMPPSQTRRIAFMVTRGSKTRRILAHDASEAIKVFEKDNGATPGNVTLSVRRARQGE